MVLSQNQQGYLLALIAYLIWGLSPIYFKTIEMVPSTEIVSHRMIWSFLFMLILISLSKNWPHFWQLLKYHKIKLLLLALSATIVSCNWLLYIWAVNNQHMLEASMGYFIIPLTNMLLGLCFLQERFNSKQWFALILAACSVLVQIWQFGSLPIISLGLAFTFSIYGLLRKKIAVDALSGMLIETFWMMPFAALYLFGFADSATSHLSNNPFTLNLLLIFAGVITTIPLLCFTAAATRLPLSTLGFFQYVGPTITFLLAIICYGEAFTSATLLTFAFIWSALAVFIWNAVTTVRLRNI